MSALNWPVPYPGPMDVTAPVPNGTIFPSAARAIGVYNSPELSNYVAKGVRLYINTTNINGATLVVKVQTKDPATGVWADIDAGAGGPSTTVTTNTMTLLTLYPGQTEVANQEISDILGQEWRVVATVTTATATFSIGGIYLE